MNNFNKDGVYFIPLGGADEIGLNMYVYACKGKLIVVDVGYGFLGNDYPGMDLALADASMLENYADDVEAIFITHAHEDHFGAIGHIWPKLRCPVYGTDFALGMISSRLREYKLEHVVDLRSVKENPIVKLQNFEVEFISVVHSVPETSALVIKTEFGNIVHATDWRFDDDALELLQTDYIGLKRVADDGVMMFVCDSTNVLVDKKQPSENEIRDSLISLIPTYKKGLIATCFASNLTRLESLVLAAKAADRTPVLVGRSLLQNMKIAKDCGYFTELPHYLDIRDAKDIPSDKVLYICTGSQGNYRSALSVIAKGESKDIKMGKGDTIIFSSKIIPGNEDQINQMQERMIADGIEVVTESDALVHTSGHASKEELKKMYELLRPSIVLPVHGDKKFIREHQRFASACGIKHVAMSRNGDVLLVNKDSIDLIGEVPTDVLGVDRKHLTPLNSELIKRRRQIMFNGSVFISVIFDENWKLESLKVSSQDIWEDVSWCELRDKIVEDVSAMIPEQVIKLDYKEKAIIEFIRGQIRKRINNATDMKAVTFIHFYKREKAE